MYNWVKAARQLIYDAANWVKLERLRKPYSMLAPKPIHFPQFSKLDRPWAAQSVMAEGLEMDALHDVYGMPRGIPQMILTVSGALYGQEFADLTIEYFGLQGETEEPEGVNRIAQRTIGKNIVFSNADPNTLPFGAGCSFAINDLETGQCKVRVHAWRWRIFMDNSSLCFENNWHTNSLTGGGWIPFILGVNYDNPEKMIADINRFTPAFKLCNLIDAKLGKGSGGDRRLPEIKQIWTDENVLKDFARLVKNLHQTWQWIKTNVDSSVLVSSDHQQQWLSEMWQRSIIKSFVSEHPKFTKALLARAVDPSLSNADREPIPLACYHAALEFEVNVKDETLSVIDAYLKYENKEPAASTLRGFYDAGRALLKSSA